MNIPNILTIFRIAMVPVFVLAFYWPGQENQWVAATIFAVAGWTDWFDGYIARKYNMMSPLGAFLDPVADKLMVDDFFGTDSRILCNPVDSSARP